MTPKHLGLAALLFASPVHAADWDARWFNPQPAEGDLVLSLPCGGAMTFRPVDARRDPARSTTER